MKAMEEVRRIMDCKQRIRNVSVIDEVNQGKSTLVDCLEDTLENIAQDISGDANKTYTRADEFKHRLTIKSTGILLHIEMTEDLLKSFKGKISGNKRMINLIDSPGHVDFSAEITTALRLSDGAVVVVDCVEDVRIHTETLLRQSLGERNKPVLAISKMDQLFLVQQTDGEEVYQTCKRVIENVN